MINLSNRSIELLKTDNIKRYKWYVLGEREDEFQTYFALGATFASCMESRAKTGDYNLDWNAQRMKMEFINNEKLDEYDKYLVQLHELIGNAKIAITEKPVEAEKQIVVPINSEYSLKVKMDADYGDRLLDHKTVTAFTKEEEKMKYKQQADLYQYAEYKFYDKKKPIDFVEIKKWKPSLPTKKEDLLGMLEWEMLDKAIEEKRTVQKIKEHLYLHTTKEQVSNTITFEREDSIIERVEELLRKAILKADYLKSLDINDIL